MSENIKEEKVASEEEKAVKKESKKGKDNKKIPNCFEAVGDFNFIM